MNKKDKYFGANGWSPSKRDYSRYEKVWEQMQLLQIEDVSTTRQDKNGTIVWKLPVKHPHGGQLIKVASFKSGYVRNQNCCYSNYQLNKCKPYTEYFKDYKWNEECTEQIFTGKYRKYTGKARILIPIEIDRLEYLIAFCLKNYYITYANHVANGDFVPKWKYESDLERHDVDREISDLQVIVDGQRYKVI